MHNEIHKFTSGKLYDFTELDDDEFDISEEINRLEAYLNDPCEDAWWVWNRCRFLGWEIQQEKDPFDGLIYYILINNERSLYL